MLIYELKQAIISKRMVISVILCFLCLVVGGSEILFGPQENIDFSYLFLFSYSCGTSSLLALIFPVFASFPYGDTYALERGSGYLLYKRAKVKKTKYILIKLFVGAFSGGVALSVPVACYLLLCIFIRGTGLINNGIEYVSHMVEFYHRQPVLYCMGYVGSAFLCGAVFALLGLAISVFVKNCYVVIFLPLVLYILCNIICSSQLYWLNPVLWWDCNLYAESNQYVTILIELTALLLFSLIFSCGVVKNAKE